MTGRRGRRRKQLVYGAKEKRAYCELKDEALDRALQGTGFGRSCGSDVRQTVERMKESVIQSINQLTILEFDFKTELYKNPKRSQMLNKEHAFSRHK